MNDTSENTSLYLCLVLVFSYVGSLYVWRDPQRSDHPDTIKKRFISVAIVNIFSPFIVSYGTNFDYFPNATLPSILGLRTENVLLALIVPLFLTMVLFLGPLVMLFKEEETALYLDPRYWLFNITNLRWIRNHIVAPISEEFIFRASMLPLLVPSFGLVKSILISPTLFGVAHFHHLIEKLRQGVEFKIAIISSVFQFAYTTIFAIYSSFLFLRTGHFISPFIVHAFCNYVGFPDFYKLNLYEPREKYFTIAMFFIGFTVWLALLFPLTEPSLYNNLLWKWN